MAVKFPDQLHESDMATDLFGRQESSLFMDSQGNFFIVCGRTWETHTNRPAVEPYKLDGHCDGYGGSLNNVCRSRLSTCLRFAFGCSCSMMSVSSVAAPSLCRLGVSQQVATALALQRPRGLLDRPDLDEAAVRDSQCFGRGRGRRQLQRAGADVIAWRPCCRFKTKIR